ncbi:hypothetical protein BSL78_16009 [Apostichopus japonicus]|uniref:Integrase catalytic domain-containing protein n=2 Tax=Stichopus japonicus TaxID=307972 RepID=A0A2G8KGI9_STIJA|nr:hypothetical protein BSL78_16009 [Apostichopus japonicus]
MIRGNLIANRINVSRDRIRESMKRVDPAGVEFRRRISLHRRVYSVPGPNYLWHIDGNHKLIRWRLVIHGGIDGYSRMPVFLNCANNNKAQTMFDAFKMGVIEFGLPKQVRSDKGGENVLVCSFMLHHPLRRDNAGSFITGRSVHNQRIERFWRDLFTGCVSKFYNLFYKMEDAEVLSCDEEVDLAALHYVFLPIIRDHLESFRQSFIHHKIRTEGNSSPLQLWQTAVDDGFPIDFIEEADLYTYGNVSPQPDQNNHAHAVNVPGGLQFTEEQQTRLRQELQVTEVELHSEEGQLAYYNVVREFIHNITQ